MPADPYAPHLQRAKALFESGEVLQAGQIWQAILKREPEHAEARTGLLKVKLWMDGQKPGPPSAPPPPSRQSLPRSPLKETIPFKALVPPAAAREADPADAPPPAAAPAAFAEPDLLTKLLKEGCTLYDMGQAEDALQKWEAILEVDPSHDLARQYVAQARHELGLGSMPMPLQPPAPAAPASPPAPSAPAAPDPEALLRGATQLYEMGSLEEAIAGLERLLALDPGHGEARAFLELARRELAQSTPAQAPSAPVPAPAPPAMLARPPEAPRSVPSEPPPTSSGSGRITHPGRPGRDTLEQKLQQGERLLLLGRYEEAGFAFEMALTLAPGDSRAQQGLRQAQELGAAAPPPAPAPPVLAPPPPPAQDSLPPRIEPGLATPAPPAAVPPARLQQPVTPARQGPELPRSLQELGQHPLLGSTKLLVGGATLVVVLGVGISILQAQRRDSRLRSAVASARESAVAPVARNSQPVDLTENVPAIRAEADAAMAIDPVRAYHRAKELLRRDPADAVGAALLEKARAALTADPAAGVSLTEYQRLLAAGDLDGADKTLDALLRARPDEPDLMAKAARLQGVLAVLHASKNEWGEARTALHRARAFFPQDPIWQARLRLLDQIRALPQAERPGWIPFLG